jgi:hypothetical protein
VTIETSFCHSYTSFGVWPRDHYMLLQRPTTGVCHALLRFPHSTEHDTQPIAYLISMQAVPYRTRGGTCCPGVSTPKIQSLADSSIASHISWWNPTVSTVPTLLKPQHRSLPRPNHISMDGRPSLAKTQAKLKITVTSRNSHFGMWTIFPTRNLKFPKRIHLF